MGFTPGTLAMHIASRRKPAVNHEAGAFIENKRYWTNQRPMHDVVNRNGVSVYQTKRVFVVYSPRAQGRSSMPRAMHSARRNQYRVRHVQKAHPRAALRRFFPQP